MSPPQSLASLPFPMQLPVHSVEELLSVAGTTSTCTITTRAFSLPCPLPLTDSPLCCSLSAVLDESEDGALYEIAVVVDPATELAQRWAPILETLSSLKLVHVRLYLNPTFQLEEIPIKRFYEYSFRPTLEYDDETGAEIQPGLRFDNVPEDVLLTFAADFQKSWLAFPKLSVHDLDNIRLADLPSSQRAKGVDAVLELEALVVEGHAREVPTNKPPRGLQLELRGAGEEEAREDTSIMANLGYFQLKANPGFWHLSIRPGRSSEVYELESTGADGWKSGDVAKTGDALFVSTFEGVTLYPRFRRKPGHELTELLNEGAASAASRKGAESFVDRIKNMLVFLFHSLTLRSSSVLQDSLPRTTGSYRHHCDYEASRHQRLHRRFRVALRGSHPFLLFDSPSY
jgi:UDP-glucose:glycoprotein glucosyltransferase